MNRKWTIAIFMACCLGWTWIFMHAYDHPTTPLCYMQWLFHFPCPTCGLTRAVLALINGNIRQSVYENPLGIIAGLCMLVFPLCIMWDWIKSSNHFEQAANRFLNALREKKYAIPFATVFLCTWIWNIYKHLC